MIISPVYAEHVLAIWPHVHLWVEAAQIKGRGDNAGELREKCAAGNGHMLLLAVEDELAVGVIVLERNGEYLHCTTLSGKVMRGLDDLVCEWRRIAAGVGCSKLSMQGRRGWARVMRKYGFTKQPDGSMEALCR